MAGATDGDVRRAANRARSDELGARFEERVATCERVARALVARTRRLGGACSEAGLYGSLAAEHPGEAVAAVLAVLSRERGVLRRVAGKSTGVRLVACAGATTEGIREAARRRPGLPPPRWRTTRSPKSARSGLSPAFQKASGIPLGLKTRSPAVATRTTSPTWTPNSPSST